MSNCNSERSLSPLRYMCCCLLMGKGWLCRKLLIGRSGKGYPGLITTPLHLEDCQSHDATVWFGKGGRCAAAPGELTAGTCESRIVSQGGGG